MQTVTTNYRAFIDAKKRSIQAILDLYTGDALTATFTSDRIVDFEIQRAGEPSKFFGFGVSHKANIKLLDANRELNITKDCYFKIKIGLDFLGTTEYKTFPKFYVSEVTRNENTNELTIVAYDALENAKAHTVSELDIAAPYTLGEYADALASFIDGVERGISDNLLTITGVGSNNAMNSCKIGAFDVDAQTATFSGTCTPTWADPDVYDWNEIPETFNVTIGSTTLVPGTYELKLNFIGGDYTGKVSGSITAGSTYTAIDDNIVKFTITKDTAITKVNFSVYGSSVYNDLKVQLDLRKQSDEQALTDIAAAALEYPEGANFEGNEPINEALNAIAEATQTIYYIDFEDVVRFRKLEDNVINKYISKDIYINLKSGANRTLQTICSATELGDNVSASLETEGETQYVRDNPFWELREDVGTLVEAALAEIGDISINEYECEWRGDPALEPGDRIAYTTKDNEIGYSYLINDTLTYNGGLRQKSDWSFKESEETASNPTSLGEVIKQTYARVDKQNKKIELLASEVNDNSSSLASLKLDTESISASVSKAEQANIDAIASLNGEIGVLTKKVEATMTSEDVKLEIKSELANGVDKVTTSTGFTFNEEGLTIAKTGSEMKTNINEDGMSVYRDNEEVLTADNQGVTAYNLHAKTYLIVGESSRFEDYEMNGETRTGCFWIGG